MFPLDSHWELQLSNPEKVHNLRKTTSCYQKVRYGPDNTVIITVVYQINRGISRSFRMSICVIKQLVSH